MYSQFMIHGQKNIKTQNVEIDSRASSGGQGKFMKYVIFLWPPIETEISVLNIRLSY